MSVWDLSVGEVSVGEVSGRGNVRLGFVSRGCVRRGNVRQRNVRTPFHFHLFRVFLCCCTGSATDLRVLLLLLDVFYLILFFDIWHKLLLSRPLGAGNSSLKVAGPPVEVRNIDPAHLFV